MSLRFLVLSGRNSLPDEYCTIAPNTPAPVPVSNNPPTSRGIERSAIFFHGPVISGDLSAHTPVGAKPYAVPAFLRPDVTQASPVAAAQFQQGLDEDTGRGGRDVRQLVPLSHAPLHHRFLFAVRFLPCRNRTDSPTDQLDTNFCVGRVFRAHPMINGHHRIAQL